MKIVGRTDSGYLVQISVDEIGVCLGLGEYARYGSGENKAKWLKATGLDSSEFIRTGTELNILGVHNYLKKILENEIKAKACAETLRQIADLITTGLPTIAIPPELNQSEPN